MELMLFSKMRIEKMNDQNEFEDRSSEIKKLASASPQEFVEYLTELHRGFDDAAPNIAPHIYATANNAVQFLSSNLPKDPTGSIHDMPNRVSKDQQEAWLDLYKVVNDPVSILEKVKDTTVTTQEIQALQSVYPDIHREMSSKILEELGKRNGAPVSYAKRLAISKFLGSPIDSTITPLSFQAIMTSSAIPVSQNVPRGTRSGKATAAQLKANKAVTDLYKTPDQAREVEKNKS